MHDNMIAMRVNTSSVPSWARNFQIQYTPTVLIIDDGGTERYRTVGFLPPEEFIPSLMFGAAKSFFDNGRPADAVKILDELAARYSRSKTFPSAVDLRRKIR